MLPYLGLGYRSTNLPVTLRESLTWDFCMQVAHSQSVNNMWIFTTFLHEDFPGYNTPTTFPGIIFLLRYVRKIPCQLHVYFPSWFCHGNRPWIQAKSSMVGHVISSAQLPSLCHEISGNCLKYLTISHVKHPPDDIYNIYSGTPMHQLGRLVYISGRVLNIRPTERPDTAGYSGIQALYK